MGDLETISHYRNPSQLGEGSFSRVYKFEDIYTAQPVAIKVMARDHLTTDAVILPQMNHPFILKYVETIQTKTSVALVSEYCPNGDLRKYIDEHGPMTESNARYLFVQLVSALEYLHNSMLYAHRDLKLENLLLDANNNLRVADFGLSVTTTTPLERNKIVGSPHYLAPEQFSTRPIPGASHKAIDIWNIGIILFKLVTGDYPFEGKEMDLLTYNILNVSPKIPDSFSPALADLILQLLQKSPASRITLEKIKVHPWFSTIAYATLPTPVPIMIDQAIRDEVHDLKVPSAHFEAICRILYITGSSRSNNHKTVRVPRATIGSANFSLRSISPIRHTPVIRCLSESPRVLFT